MKPFFLLPILKLDGEHKMSMYRKYITSCKIMGQYWRRRGFKKWHYYGGILIQYTVYILKIHSLIQIVFRNNLLVYKFDVTLHVHP